MCGIGIAYLYDGSLEGLLSAVFVAFERHEHPDEIVDERAYQPRLAQEALSIGTDFERAARVRAGIERTAGRNAFTAVVRASTCDDYETGTVVYRFVRYVMQRPEGLRGSPVLDERANPVVADLMRLSGRAVNECEKMRQFIRFSHLENGIWYAQCNPNASVVPLVMGHFAARLNDQPFVIYDENHHLAGVYDGYAWQLVSGSFVNEVAPTQHDTYLQEAWKRFYDALSVDARYNPDLRRHFLPTRLWRNVVELQPRRPGLQRTQGQGA